jgi:O-antigen/teichoic acid export membrane protein
VASNFAALSAAEVACRVTSVAVTLYLAKCLGAAGYGRIEFAFNIVFWLVLLVREGLDVIASREIARHPRLIRPMVNHILAIRVLLALGLLAALVAVGSLTLSEPAERSVLALYGLMLLTTALGLDFVYRAWSGWSWWPSR